MIFNFLLIFSRRCVSFKFSVFWDVKPDILKNPYQRSALIIEAADTSEVFGNFYKNIRHNIPEDNNQDF
jgi:hypothetical protein